MIKVWSENACRLSEGLQGQNYFFHNNTEMLFALSTVWTGFALMVREHSLTVLARESGCDTLVVKQKRKEMVIT